MSIVKKYFFVFVALFMCFSTAEAKRPEFSDEAVSAVITQLDCIGNAEHFRGFSCDVSRKYIDLFASLGYESAISLKINGLLYGSSGCKVNHDEAKEAIKKYADLGSPEAIEHKIRAIFSGFIVVADPVKFIDDQAEKGNHVAIELKAMELLEGGRVYSKDFQAAKSFIGAHIEVQVLSEVVKAAESSRTIYWILNMLEKEKYVLEHKKACDADYELSCNGGPKTDPSVTKMLKGIFSPDGLVDESALDNYVRNLKEHIQKSAGTKGSF